MEQDVRYQKGVGPHVAALLSKLGIGTVKDLMYYFPREYEDRSHPTEISKLKMGEQCLIKVEIVKLTLTRTRRNFSIVKGIVKDNSGSVGVMFFNQPYLVKLLKPKSHIFISGKFDRDAYSGSMIFIPREYEVINEDNKNDMVVPKYPLTEGMTQKLLKKLVRSAISAHSTDIVDPMPQIIKEKFKLKDLKWSVMNMHFPQSMEVIKDARRRLAFDELLSFQLGILHNRKKVEQQKGIKFKTEGPLIEKFKGVLPFTLTGAQDRVLNEILNDMSSEHVMSRLIQGDVGSGKTIVALYSMIVAVQNGYQAAIMAPTEILATQHYNKIKSLLDGLGVEVLLLTAGIKSGRKELFEKIKGKDPFIIIGTHAIIEEGISFGNLGMVVIDEQHRFGVEQRLQLRKKGEKLDLLVMTATPIPRTLALTIYGDLNRSIIDELPPGRTKIITRYVRENERARLYEFIRAQVKAGRQSYIVCPLVDESESLDLKAVEEEVHAIKKVFPEYHVAMIHGKMKANEKEKAMADFVSGKVNILVSTTVIEVGIDVPNSTIMIVEHAERFGLSQLHQLRGRIGRGDKQSYCFLVADPKNDTAKARIDAMLKTDDGFKIAEADLKLRGPGEFLGVHQSGLPNFRVADIINDEDVIRDAREAAVMLLEKDVPLEELNIKYWGNKLE
jgi:ATP-dependent DNA helicase RecG